MSWLKVPFDRLEKSGIVNALPDKASGLSTTLRRLVAPLLVALRFVATDDGNESSQARHEINCRKNSNL